LNKFINERKKLYPLEFGRSGCFLSRAGGF
jgi:hypothetical protein